MNPCKEQNNLKFTPTDPFLFAGYSELNLLRRGKVKDIYDLGDMLLMVSTDRLTASGKSLEQEVKGKGKIVNQLSAYWFRKLRKIIPNHLVSADSRCFPESIRNCTELHDGCSMLVWEATPLPVRCVVRGYLTGEGWKEYQQKGEICGVKLPAGLVEYQRLPFPIFTPTTKGLPGGVNVNIQFDELQDLFGKSMAEHLREASLRLYFTAWMIAREKGVLIAETKFEFGLHDGKLMLIDECLTPDNSRFWVLENYRHGGAVPSMDKQILIDYLESPVDHSEDPLIPEELLQRIGEKYREAYECIIGRRAPG